MGFKEGFGTTMGVIFALVVVLILIGIFRGLGIFIRWVFPKLKGFAIIHPIWSFFIIIFVLAISVGIIDSVCQADYGIW